MTDFVKKTTALARWMLPADKLGAPGSQRSLEHLTSAGTDPAR